MKLLKYILPVLLLVMISFAFQTATAQAPQKTQQKGKVTGKVVDSKTNAPIEYATIGLFRANDSVLVTGNITKSTGEFSVDAPYGRFYLKVEFIGYKGKTGAAFNVSESAPEVNAGTIKLEDNSTNLQGVEIEAEKSQYQVGIDKKVFNVGKDLTSAGGSASDVLQNVPSVSVDMDGNVALRGSGSVRILIDGKPSGLTGVSKADILAQLPASSIESIEVITNPSAKYDSEGMAGIINIVLKKQQQAGFNGMVTLTAGTGNKYNGSVNMNYSKNKLNFFASYDGNYTRNNGYGINNRETIINDTASYLDQHSDIVRKSFPHNIRGGIDYRINDKTTLSLSSLYKTGSGSNSSEMEYKSYDANRSLLSIFTRNNAEDNKNTGMDNSMNFRRELKKKGQQLTADLAYNFANENADIDITQKYYNSDYSPASSLPVLQNNLTNTKQVNALAQTDYVHPINDKSKLEAGLKATMRSTNNDFKLKDYDHSSQTWMDDTSYSYKFIYDEAIYAGYALYSNSFKTVNYKVGARAEQTSTRSELENTGETHEVSYIDIFPSVSLSKTLEKNNAVQLSYTRRINRPSMGNLNPFQDYQDPYNLRKGNPFLKPEYITSLDAGHTKYWDRYSLTTGLYYRFSRDVIGRIKNLDTITGITITSFDNLAHAQNYGAEFTFNANPAKWIRLMINFNYYRNILDGENLREGYSSDSYNWNTKMNANITVWKNMDIQLTGNYRAPMEVPMGTIREMYSMDMGAKKDVLKGKGTVNLRVSDVLNSQKFRIDAEGPGFVNYMEFKRDTRTVYLGFTYRINSYQEKKKKDQNEGGGGLGDF